MDNQRQELLKALQSKEDEIAELQLRISSKDALLAEYQAGYNCPQASPAKEGNLPDFSNGRLLEGE